MRIQYKKVKKFVAHCGDCGEELGGNGSLMSPYKCSCGEWEFVFWRSSEEFKAGEHTLKKDRYKIEEKMRNNEV